MLNSLRPHASARHAPRGVGYLHGLLHVVFNVVWLLCAVNSGLVMAQQAPATRYDPSIVAQRVFQVPPVVNLELAQAQAALTKAGFQGEAIPLDRGIGRRIVERSDPVEGTRFTVNQRPVVKLYHRAERPAGGDTPAQRMPSLIGMTCAEASNRLAALRLRLASCEVGAPTGTSGAARINRQEPQADSALNANPAVSLVLRAWTEPEYVLVPQLRDVSANDAVARLRQSGLRPDVAAGVVDNWHYVQAQSPLAGSRVAPQSGVRLTLAARYVVPDLSGRSCAQAQALVRDAGLGALQCRVEPGVGNVPPGRVYRQAPVPQTVLAAVQPVQAWEQPTLVIVPDVQGRPEATANTLLAQQKLRVRLSGPAATQGRLVAAQSPPGGTQVLPGSEVSLTLELSIPPLNGLDCAGAGARAREYGFDTLACEQKRAGPAQALNRVFAQTPSAGTRMAAAQPLQVQIAMPIKVPRVVGQGLAQALGALEQASLRGEPDARDGDRDVASQRPEAGTEVAPGTLVRLATQRFDRVPTVTGLNLPDAQARIAKAGFTASVDRNDRPASRKVDRQAPAAGERLALGGAVQVFTHVEVAVPDVVKQRLPAAGATIAQSGLRAKPDREDNADAREVRAQRPPAGTMVPEQSEIALDTVRLVTVPALAGASCGEAGGRVNAAGLRLGSCNVQSALPLVLGAAVVSTQTPAANALVDEGTSVTLQADPPWWSAPVIIGAALSLGLGLARRFWPKARSPAVKSEPPPTPPLPPAAALAWRVAPDRKPVASLRMKGKTDPAADAAGSNLPARWRVEQGEPVVCLRSNETLEGDSHAHRD